MNSENPNEIWQVEAAGQVYEAPFSELPEWINEGSLQPGDKVRKGNLRWIEARKVPALVPFFNARAKGEPMPIAFSFTDAAASTAIDPPPASEPASAAPGQADNQSASPNFQPAQHTTSARVSGCCFRHPELRSDFACSNCFLQFCKACPRSYGGSVRICPECGQLCKSVAQVTEATRRSEIAAKYSGEPFGFADLGRAFAHPFKFRSSLVFGALMFMVFTLGQSASSIGGIFLLAAAILCAMLANMLWFGVLANTIGNFTQGNLDTDFMPSFEDFSLWDDVVHPFFLSIGAYLSSFGPFLLVAAIGVYLVMSAASEQMKNFNEQLTRVPGTPLYAPDRTAEQSKEVQDVLAKVNEFNQKRIDAYREQVERRAENAESGEFSAEDPAYRPEDLDAEAAEIENMLREARQKQLESLAPGTDSDPQERLRAGVGSILRLAAPLVVIGVITLLWGLFYFPAACAVAGYSRSFLATINPMVGLDTIRRLGSTYLKILLMGFLILLASGFVTFVLQMLLFPFNLPRIGNLAAIAAGSIFTFYFSVVFSCVLGYALFKNADRLSLYR